MIKTKKYKLARRLFIVFSSFTIIVLGFTIGTDLYSNYKLTIILIREQID
jgi:hypothetical protein